MSAVSKRPTWKMDKDSLFEDTNQFVMIVRKGKNGGILTLVRNNIPAPEIQRSTGDTEIVGVELT